MVGVWWRTPVVAMNQVWGEGKQVRCQRSVRKRKRKEGSTYYSREVPANRDPTVFGGIS